MDIEIKILDERLLVWGAPRYHSAEAAGLDLRACIDQPLTLSPQGSAVLVKSGIAISMPHANMAAILASRSGLGHKGLSVSQGIGTIDADYNAEILISLWAREPRDSITIMPGDRVAQLVFVPILRPGIVFVDSLSRVSVRGGFGSTGVASA